MNERIKELAEQCGFRPQPSIYDRNQSFDIEKFAELIIEECARESDKQTIYCRGIPWGKWIKEHFQIL